MYSFIPFFSVLLSLVTNSLALVTNPSLLDLIRGDPELNRFTDLFRRFPNLMNSIRDTPNITVFAFRDQAWQEARKYAPGLLGSDMTYYRSLMSYHFINGTFLLSDFEKRPKFLPATFLTDRRYANLNDGQPQVVEVALVKRRYRHVDGSEKESPEYYQGLYPGYRRYYPKEYSRIHRANRAFAGGVLHVVNRVILPPENISTTVNSTLTAATDAFNQAGLMGTIDSLKNITVFAPRNGAFRAAGSFISRINKAQLADILSYHVVPTRAFSVDLIDNQKLKTLQGRELTIRIKNGLVFVNGARVITSDVITSNGVIHVIDGILNPNAMDDMPGFSPSTQAPAFPSTTSAPGVPLTSSITISPGANATPNVRKGQKSAASPSKSSTTIAIVGAALAVAAGMMA